MSRLRSLVFAIAYVGWNILACLIFSWALLASRRHVYGIVRSYLDGVTWLERRILGLYWRRTGPPLPAATAIYAMKHQSTFETMKLHALFGDPAVVLKAELMRLPIWGAFAQKMGMIPVERGAGAKSVRPMLDAAHAAIAAGRPIVIFPQGTRTAPGEVLPYKQGVARLYRVLDVPVIPVAVDSGLFWPKHGMKRGGTTTVEFLEPIPPGLPQEELVPLIQQRLEEATDRLMAETRREGRIGRKTDDAR